jgi:hypothetical protein
LVAELGKNLGQAEFVDIEEFAKVNAGHLCNQKLESIIAKVEESETNFQLKVPQNFRQL